jgi:hypothetical protein
MTYTLHVDKFAQHIATIVQDLLGLILPRSPAGGGRRMRTGGCTSAIEHHGLVPTWGPSQGRGGAREYHARWVCT